MADKPAKKKDRKPRPDGDSKPKRKGGGGSWLRWPLILLALLGLYVLSYYPAAYAYRQGWLGDRAAAGSVLRVVYWPVTQAVATWPLLARIHHAGLRLIGAD